MASTATEAKSLKKVILCCRSGRKKLKEKELKHSGCQCAWVTITITKKMVHGRCFG